MIRFWGYTCDTCGDFFTLLKYFKQGKKRRLHYCSEECQAKSEVQKEKKLGP
jgi:hypothetical protein